MGIYHKKIIFNDGIWLTLESNDEEFINELYNMRKTMKQIRTILDEYKQLLKIRRMY